MSLAKRFLSLFSEHRRLVKEVDDFNQAALQMKREVDSRPRKPAQPKKTHPVVTVSSPVPLFIPWENFKVGNPECQDIGAFVDKVRGYAGVDLKGIVVSVPPLPHGSHPGTVVLVFTSRLKASLDIVAHIATMLRLYDIPSVAFMIRHRPGEVTVTFHNPVWFKKFLPKADR